MAFIIANGGRQKYVNPFASIGRTGASKGKVKVRDICLNISFLTDFSSFFTHMWKKVQSSLKKKKKKKKLGWCWKG